MSPRRKQQSGHLVEAFLDMMSAERGAVGNTLAAYRRDLVDFSGHVDSAKASRDDELVLRGTLADIAAQVAEPGVRRTAVVIVGRVLSAEHFADSHLYSTTRCR